MDPKAFIDDLFDKLQAVVKRPGVKLILGMVRAAFDAAWPALASSVPAGLTGAALLDLVFKALEKKQPALAPFFEIVHDLFAAYLTPVPTA